jgi:DUF971 family protein
MYPNQYCNPCNEPEPCIEVPAPPDCIGEPCDEIVLDTCVRYTGPAIPCLGITTGANLNQVIQIIAARLCDCCDGTPPVINCVVSEWSEWGPCVDGVQTRTRTVIQQPQNGGTACPPLVETRECCTPVNCVVSAWGPWSDCVGGVKTRTRTVTTPASCGGTPCPVLEETIECSACNPLVNTGASSPTCETVQVSFSEDGTATTITAELVSVASPTVVLQSHDFVILGGASSYMHEFTGVAAGSYLVKLYKVSAFGDCDVITTAVVNVTACAICTPLTDIVLESDNCETFFVSFEDDGSATVLYAELFKTTAPTTVVSTKNWNPLGSAATYSHTFTGLTTAGDYFVKIYKDAGVVKCLTITSSEVRVEECIECGTIDPSWVSFGTWDCPSIGYNYSITVPSSAAWATGSDLFVNVQKTGTSEVLIQSTYTFTPSTPSSSSFWTFNSPFGGGQMDALNVPAGTSVTLTLMIDCGGTMIQRSFTYVVPDCPVDCVVSDWSEWSDCIEGNQTRTRTVITPASGGGAPCPMLEENKPCDLLCPPPTDLTATISE